ncbi:VWA domain-containing protein [Neptunomonas japonica]|uniref:Ca-activated chloride channel homolog n=1 Tax=Neptunomonas japonica JAMM 1380 TaxID=1441457 RepID=A0A7R6PJQ4_9GAMM|nr:VWA domain-containing protein [Neptunomonas japonica]BBB31462.1 Ca-activated chloride channel homolog [Neptunomonas japonica JAMM 1380]
MLAAFHFQQPFWLLLLPLFAVLGYGWLRHKRNTSQYWSEVCDPALLPLLVKEGQARSSSAPALAVLVAVLLSVAAAQPVWKQQPVPAFKQGGAVVIALDLSASMNATDIKPSRLQRAHFKIEDLLGRLPDSQVALLVYAGDAFVVTPLTEDTGTILAQLPVMTPEIMPAQGSRADRALVKAGDILAQAGVRGGTVLLVSDEVSPAQIAAAASRLAQQGRSVSILAVGTAQGAPVPTQFGPMKDQQGQVILARTDMQQMREAASLGGGSAVQLVADESDLSTLIATFSTGQREEVKQGNEVERWVAEGPWFVLLALPLLLPLFRRGVASILLPALCFSALSLGGLGIAPNAEAGSELDVKEGAASSIWQDLWKTADQQAAQQYQAGDKAAAAQAFSDARWKQIAQYETQDYAAAIESLPEPETAADWYNRGNILAQQQRLDEAIAAYEQTLQRDPKHENATFNKQLLEKQKQQQKEQDKKQSKQGSKSNSEQDSEQKKQQNSSQQQGPSDQQDQQGQKNSSADNSSQGDQDEKNASAETPQQSESAQKDSPSETSDQTTEQAQDAEAAKAEEQQRAADYLKQQMDKVGPYDGQAASGNAQAQSAEPISESEQARQQLLNRIVDDPAGLWRRKFMYQYRQQAEQHLGEEKTW